MTEAFTGEAWSYDGRVVKGAMLNASSHYHEGGVPAIPQEPAREIQVEVQALEAGTPKLG